MTGIARNRAWVADRPRTRIAQQGTVDDRSIGLAVAP
jgi:hypothetical protein